MNDTNMTRYVVVIVLVAANLMVLGAMYLWLGYEESQIWKRSLALFSWQAIDTDVLNRELGLSSTSQELIGGVDSMGNPKDDPDVLLEYLNDGIVDKFMLAIIVLVVLNIITCAVMAFVGKSSPSSTS